MQEKDNLALYDSFDGKVQSGKWKIETSQTLTCSGAKVNQETIDASQELIVENEFFSITNEKIVQRTPLSGSQGQYTNIIPHVVLNGALPSASGNYMLLLLKKDEISAEKSVKLSDYFAPAGGVLKPGQFCFSKEKLEAVYGTVRMTASLFDSIAPRKAELPYLVHYRQVFTGDKPEMNLDADGMFTVIISNRIPEYTDGKKTEYKAFLVTLEGLLEYLDGKARQKSGCEYVELLYADSWEFIVTGKKPDSFRIICSKLKKKNSYDWLYRLPLPEELKNYSGTDKQKLYVKEKLERGYVPVLYHTRPGDEGLCFYRAPLVPKPITELPTGRVFESADSALCYDEKTGIFDTSLAAAFEAGRFAALQDEAYLDALYSFRKEAENKLDELHVQDMWKLGDNPETELADLMGSLDAKELVQQADESGPDVPVNSETPEDTREKSETFLQENGEDVYQALEAYVEPLAKWLAKLLLLYPVPVEDLIPHGSLLGEESVKFFYLDKNWQNALYDGATSIGLYSTRQSSYNKKVRSLLYEKTENALYEYRASLYGMEPPQDRQSILSGFLVRAQMTSQWPTSSVSAKDKDQNELPILRMEHITEDTLLVIFDGIASFIVVNEPEEGIALVLNQEELEVYRDNGSVLLLDPGHSGGMVSRCAQKQGISVDQMGSAAFVKCFLSTGERVVFGEVSDRAESV